MSEDLENLIKCGFSVDESQDEGLLYGTNDGYDYFENCVFKSKTAALIQSEAEKDLDRPPLKVNGVSLAEGFTTSGEALATSIKRRYSEIFSTTFSEPIQRILKNVYYNIQSQTHGNKLYGFLQTMLPAEYMIVMTQFDRKRELRLGGKKGILYYTEQFTFNIVKMSEPEVPIETITVPFQARIFVDKGTYNGVLTFTISRTPVFQTFYQSFMARTFDSIVTRYDAILLTLASRIDTPYIGGLFGRPKAASLSDQHYLSMLFGISDRVVAAALALRKIDHEIPWELNPFLDFCAQFYIGPQFSTTQTDSRLVYLMIMENLVHFIEKDAFVRFQRVAQNKTKKGRGFFKVRETIQAGNAFIHFVTGSLGSIIFRPNDTRIPDEDIQVAVRTELGLIQSLPNNTGHSSRSIDTVVNTGHSIVRPVVLDSGSHTSAATNGLSSPNLGFYE